MVTPLIRLARPEDAPAIATVHVRTWQFAYRGQIPDTYLDSMSIESRTARWQEILEDLDSQRGVFVAEIEDKVVGFCVVGRSRDDGSDDSTGELYAIYVDAQSMNRGVGLALIRGGQEYLGAQGYTKATLWVLESNQRARRFYERQGWAPDGAMQTIEFAGASILELRYAVSLPKQSKI